MAKEEDFVKTMLAHGPVYGNKIQFVRQGSILRVGVFDAQEVGDADLMAQAWVPGATVVALSANSRRSPESDVPGGLVASKANRR